MQDCDLSGLILPSGLQVKCAALYSIRCINKSKCALTFSWGVAIGIRTPEGKDIFFFFYLSQL